MFNLLRDMHLYQKNLLQRVNAEIGPYATFIRNMTLLGIPVAVLMRRRKKTQVVDVSPQTIATYGAPIGRDVRLGNVYDAIRPSKKIAEYQSYQLLKEAAWSDVFFNFAGEWGKTLFNRVANQVPQWGNRLWTATKRAVKYPLIKTFDVFYNSPARDIVAPLKGTISQWRKEFPGYFKKPSLLGRAATGWAKKNVKMWYQWGLEPVIKFATTGKGVGWALLGLSFLNPKNIIEGITRPFITMGSGFRNAFKRIASRSPLGGVVMRRPRYPTMPVMGALTTQKTEVNMYPFNNYLTKQAGLVDLLKRFTRGGLRTRAVDVHINPTGLIAPILAGVDQWRLQASQAGKVKELSHSLLGAISKQFMRANPLSVRISSAPRFNFQQFLSSALPMAALLGAGALTGTAIGAMGSLMDSLHESIGRLKAKRVFRQVFEANKEQYTSSPVYTRNPEIYRMAFETLLRIAPKLAADPMVVKHVLDTVSTYGNIPADLLSSLGHVEQTRRQLPTSGAMLRQSVPQYFGNVTRVMLS